MNLRPVKTVSIPALGVCLAIISCTPLTLLNAAEPPAAATGKPAEKESVDKERKSQTLFDGKTLGKWKAAEKFDFQAHGPIVVKDGAIEIGSGSPASGIRYTGKLPRLDYEISLEAKRIVGSDFFCGMTFPVGESYCTLIVGGWGGSIVGLSNVDGASAAENSSCTVGEFKNDHWHKILLRVTSAKIEVWIDKEKVIDQPTADHKFTIWWEQEPMRPLGIATWETGSALRNMRLEKLGKSEPKEAGAKDVNE